jgi:hypothetical protein
VLIFEVLLNRCFNFSMKCQSILCLQLINIGKVVYFCNAVILTIDVDDFIDG